MDLIPAIDIRGGKCVQLKQGDYARETVYGVDPVAMAQHWHAQGATRLHVVDLDAAKEGRPVNDAVIRRIVAHLRGDVSVQVAGGVRDHNAIHRWIESGADRVVIGTWAVEHPDVIEKAMEKHQEKIAVAVDARAAGRPSRAGSRPATRPSTTSSPTWPGAECVTSSIPTSLATACSSTSTSASSTTC